MSFTPSEMVTANKVKKGDRIQTRARHGAIGAVLSIKQFGDTHHFTCEGGEIRAKSNAKLAVNRKP